MHGFTENYVRVETAYRKELVNELTKVELLGFSEDGMSLDVKIL